MTGEKHGSCRTVVVPGPHDVGLSATLRVPEPSGGGRRPPVALILNGSGPLDRDSNMKDQALNVANTIADSLAEVGVASLRYDKRGCGRSEGDFMEAGFNLETVDAASAVAWLRDCADIDPDRIGIIGHSVGATIAIRLAAAETDVRFLVLLAGPAKPGLEVMEWQSDRIAESLPGPDWLLGRWFRRRQRADRQALLNSEDETVRLHKHEVPALWFRQFMAYDPRPDLAVVNCPVLAITGAKDLQVDSADLALMAATVKGPCDIDSPADLTHVLRTDPGRPSLSSYRKLVDEPVDPALLQRLTRWLTELLG